MFQFIEPEEQYEYRRLITPFLQSLKYTPQLCRSFKRWRGASFLLAKERSHEVEGGALLLQQKIETIHPTLQAHLKTHHPTLKYLWTGAISLHVDEEIRGRDFEKICQLFYSSLLADLIAFGIKEDARFLALKMLPLDSLMIDRQGFWPYMAQVNPQSSRDKLFHGILTLFNLPTGSEKPRFHRCVEREGNRMSL